MASSSDLKDRSQAFKKSLYSPIRIIGPKTLNSSVKLVTATTTTMTPAPTTTASNSNMSSKNLLSDCCLPSCSSSKWNSERSGIRFHPFPGLHGKDKDMRALWIQILFPNGVHGSRDLPCSSMMVCSRHFRPEDYYKVRNSGKNLSTNAIPTLNLGHNYSISELLGCKFENALNTPTPKETPGAARVIHEVLQDRSEGEVITADFDEVPDDQILSDDDNQVLIDEGTSFLMEPENPILIDAGTPVVFETEDGLFAANTEGQTFADDTNENEDIDLDKYSLTDAFIKSIKIMEQETGRMTAVSHRQSASPFEATTSSSRTPKSVDQFSNVSARIVGKNKVESTKVFQTSREKFHFIKRPFKIVPNPLEGGKMGVRFQLDVPVKSALSKSSSDRAKMALVRESPPAEELLERAGKVRRTKFGLLPNVTKSKLPQLTSEEVAKVVKIASHDHNYCDCEPIKSRKESLKKNENSSTVKMEIEKSKEKEKPKAKAKEVVSPMQCPDSPPKNVKIPQVKQQPREPQKEVNKAPVTDSETKRVKMYHEYYLSQIRLAVSYKYRKATYTSKLNDMIPCPHCIHTTSSVAEIQSHLTKHLYQDQLKMMKCALCPYSTLFYEPLVEHDEKTHYNIEREGKTMKEMNYAEINGLLSLVSRTKGISPDFHLFPGVPWLTGKTRERFWPIVTKEFNQMYPPVNDDDQFRSELFLKCRFYTLKKLALKLHRRETGEGPNLTFDDEIRAVRSFIEHCVRTKRPIFDRVIERKKKTAPSVELTPMAVVSPQPMKKASPPSTSKAVESQSLTKNMMNERDLTLMPEEKSSPVDDVHSTPTKVAFTLGEESKIIQSLPGRKEVFIVDINKITSLLGTSQASEPSSTGSLDVAGKHAISSSQASKFELTTVNKEIAKKPASPKKQKAAPPPPSATGSYPCTMCASEFKLFKNLEKHMVWHREKAERAVTQSINQALAHLNPAMANTFNCDCCDFSAGSTDELDQHMSSHFTVAADDGSRVEESTEVCRKKSEDTNEKNDDKRESDVKSESEEEEEEEERPKSSEPSSQRNTKVPCEDFEPDDEEDSDDSDEFTEGDEFDDEEDALEYSDHVDSDPDFDDLSFLRFDRTKIKKSKQFKMMKKELEEERYWDSMAKKSFERQQQHLQLKVNQNVKKMNRRKRDAQRWSVKKLTNDLLRKKLSKTPLNKDNSETSAARRKDKNSLTNTKGPAISKASPVKSLPQPEVTKSSTKVASSSRLSPSLQISQPPEVMESPPKLKTVSPPKLRHCAVAQELSDTGAKPPKLEVAEDDRLRPLAPTILDEAAASLAVTAVVHPSERTNCDKCPFSGNDAQLRLHEAWAHSSWNPKGGGGGDAVNTHNSDFAKQLFRKKRRRKRDSLHSVVAKKKKKIKPTPPPPQSVSPASVSQEVATPHRGDTDTLPISMQSTHSPSARKKRHNCFYCIYVCYSRRDMKNHIAEQRHLEPVTFVRKRVKLCQS